MNRLFLDEISKEKAILWNRFDFHAVIVNTKFLELTNINKNTKVPDGGIIEYFEEGEFKGTPNGVFHDSATKIALSKFPQLDLNKKKDFLKLSHEYLFKYGVTSYMEAYVSSNVFEIYENLYSEKENFRKLPRTSLSISVRKLFFDADDEQDQTLNLLGIYFI